MTVKDLQYSQLLYSYTGLSVKPEFADTGPIISVPQKQLTVRFVHSLVLGYTGFLIYRTLNLSPNRSGITAIDYMMQVCNIYGKPFLEKKIRKNLFKKSCLTTGSQRKNFKD